MLQFKLHVLDRQVAEHLKYMPEKHEADHSNMVLAPMPGMVKAVHVDIGQAVRKLTIVK